MTRSGSFLPPVSRFHSSKVSFEIFPSTSSCANLRRCAWLLNGIADVYERTLATMNATMPTTISTAIAPAQNPVLKMAPIASHPDMNTASDTTGNARASEMDVCDTGTSPSEAMQGAGPAREPPPLAEVWTSAVGSESHAHADVYLREVKRVSDPQHLTVAVSHIDVGASSRNANAGKEFHHRLE